MSDSSEHVSFETLNDYVDGALDTRAIARVDRHLAICSPCASELSSMRDLIASTAALPRSVLPEDDMWASLRASIEQRKEVVLRSPLLEGAQAATPIRSNQPWWQQRGSLVAAAVLLMAGSSATTVLVLRNDGGDQNPPVVVAPPGLPRSFRVAEGQYVNAIAELRRAVDDQRSQLSPETIRTVDHSLAVVDSAINEARDALLADPNNRTLVDLLSTSYQRKLDLLRRTSELTSKI
jgi:hypothetical protein